MDSNVVGHERTKNRLLLAVLVGAIVFFAWLVVRRAWLSDDAFITFRTIDNFLHGYGLTWNVSERVQSYTHPLWMLLLTLASFLTGELLYTTLFISIILAVLTVIGLAGFISRSVAGAILVVLALAMSSAFVDYATSGLENPLSYFLLVVFFILFFRLKLGAHKLFWISMVASLAIVNRQDTLLLYLPALAWVLGEYVLAGKGRGDKFPWRRLAGGLGFLLLGQAPLFIWEAFSLAYYGFPFPNTAYAKLASSVPAGELARQGLRYLADSLANDPLTLALVGAAIGAALLALILARRQANRAAYWQLCTIALGMLFYLAYLVVIGGDFMSGRFLALPLLAGVIILARFDLSNLGWLPLGALLAVVLALGLAGAYPTTGSAQRQASINTVIDRSAHGISNERLVYAPYNSLFALAKAGQDANSGLATAHERAAAGLQARISGERAVVARTIGMFGYYAGPKVYIIDRLALADPLLARLPPEYSLDWRIGHPQRALPEGYFLSRVRQRNLIRDDNLATYFDHLNTIISGRLLSWQRLVEIWKMNTGQYNDLINEQDFRYPEMVTVAAGRLASDAPVEFPASGVLVELDEIAQGEQLELDLAAGADYRLLFYLGEQPVGQRELALSDSPPGSLEKVYVTLPAQAARAGFDRVHILPTRGDGPFRIGAFAVPAVGVP